MCVYINVLSLSIFIFNGDIVDKLLKFCKNEIYTHQFMKKS